MHGMENQIMLAIFLYMMIIGVTLVSVVVIAGLLIKKAWNKWKAHIMANLDNNHWFD